MSPLVITAALSILAPAAASAQPSAPPITVAPVTVQAQPLTHSEAQKKSEKFVQTYAATSPVTGQYARWQDPLCIQVTGLPADQAAAVKARIEDVAQALGLKIQRPGCHANIEVVFTATPQDLLDWVAKHSNAIIGFHYPSQTKALKTVTRPVQAWYMTATLGGASDNTSLATATVGCVRDAGGGGCGTAGNMGSVGLPDFSTPAETIDTPGGHTPNGCGGHKFSVCLSSLFHNVLVVVDARRIQGQPLTPLTDYLAMLALSQPKSLDGCLALPSIIDLYAPTPCPERATPDGLTPADAAFLTSLYAIDTEQTKQTFEIAARMAQILVSTNPRQGGKP